MTELTGCGDIRQALGVYVVGAIDPAERAMVDAHLAQCPDCREELAGLAGLPALLGRVPLAEAERFALDSDELRALEEPPAELLDSLLGQIAVRRRTRRWRGLAVAAAAAIIAVGGGIGGGILISGGPSPAPSAAVHAPKEQAELVRGSNPATHVMAAVYYSPRASGTTMQIQVSGIPNGTHCQFWMTTTSGQHLLVGGWTVNGNHDNANWYPAASRIAPAKVRSFDISAGGKVLVTVPAS